jgi:hypothetical protein
MRLACLNKVKFHKTKAMACDDIKKLIARGKQPATAGRQRHGGQARPITTRVKATPPE